MPFWQRLLRLTLVFACLGGVITTVLFVELADLAATKPVGQGQANSHNEHNRNKQNWSAQITAATDWLADKRDWLNVIFTGLVALFTLTLSVSTSRLSQLAASQSLDMQELAAAARNNAIAAARQADTAAQQHAALQQQAIATRVVADEAAKSADIAERALVELEAPFVLVRITSSGIPDQPRDPNWEGNTGHIRFVFSNYGRTPARIISDCSISVEADKGIMPTPIEVGRIEENFGLEGVIIPPNGGSSEEFEFSVYGPLVRLDINKNELFFMGFVRYRDIFGNRYRSGFCFMLLTAHRRFIVAGDDRYNYCRRETGSERLGP
jgi:hypothetical protein